MVWPPTLPVLAVPLVRSSSVGEFDPLSERSVFFRVFSVALLPPLPLLPSPRLCFWPEMWGGQGWREGGSAAAPAPPATALPVLVSELMPREDARWCGWSGNCPCW